MNLKGTFQFAEIVEAVFASVLNTTLSREFESPSCESPRYVGSVEISGGWSCCVCLSMGLEAAHLATMEMMRLGSTQVTSDDILEVVGELTNMIGGHFKSNAPEMSRLSVPSVCFVPPSCDDDLQTDVLHNDNLEEVVAGLHNDEVRSFVTAQTQDDGKQPIGGTRLSEIEVRRP